jgi:hypothetical protein
MRLASLLLGCAAALAAAPALAQTSPPPIAQGGSFSTPPTIMQGGFPNSPAAFFRPSFSHPFPRPFFPGFRFGLHDFHRHGGGLGLGRFGPNFPAALPFGFGYGYGGGYYGGDYGYDNGGAVPEADQQQPVVMLNAAPPPPPPVSLGITTATTPSGVTIVRGHTQY